MNDNEGTEIGTEEFTVRELQKPGNPTIPEGVNNKVDAINTSNVSNATINVKFTTPNTGNVTLVVEVTDVAKDDKASSTVKFTKEVSALAETVTIDNADFSSLNDGTLTVKAYVVDSEGNKSEENTATTFTKSTEKPSIAVESATRTDASNATVNLFIDGGTKYVYYMLKETNEVAPSKADVIASETKADVSSTKKINLTSGLSSGKTYTLYMVACTDPAASGNITSDDVVSVTIPKDGLDKLAQVTDISSTQKDGVYTWSYVESTDGLVGYKVVLKKDGTDIVAIKDIKVNENNEVNFFEELKKAEGTYTITIYAVGDGITKATSEESSAVTVGEIDPVVSKIDLKLDSTTKTKLTWTTTGSASNVKDFTLQIAKYNSELGSSKKYEIVETVNNITDYFYDVVDIINKHGVGQYGFVVTANPKDDVLKSSKKSTTNDITGASPTYTDPIYYYINDTVKLETTEVTGNSVTLKGTLNKGDYASDAVTYELYKSKDGQSYEKVTASELSSLTAGKSTFTHTESSLTGSSTWYFKIKTIIKDTDTTSKNNRTNVSSTGFYDSEPITVKLPNNISLGEAFTYKAFTDTDVSENGEIKSSLADKSITYDGNTIYIKDSTVTSYTAEDVAEAETIINVLKQLKTGDTIIITDNKVSELGLKATKTYELGQNATSATLKLSGSDMTVKGTVKSVAELTDAHTYDLSGLTISGKTLHVKATTNVKIKLPATADITFEESVTDVTLNGVKLTATALGDMTYADNTLTLDSSTEELTTIDGENDAENPLSIVLDSLPSALTLGVTNGINIKDSKEKISATKAITINSDNNTIDLSNVTFDGTGKVTLTAAKPKQIYVILDDNSKQAGNMETLSNVAQVQFTDTMYMKSDKTGTTYSSDKTSKVQLNTSEDNTNVEIAGKAAG